MKNFLSYLTCKYEKFQVFEVRVQYGENGKSMRWVDKVTMIKGQRKQ